MNRKQLLQERPSWKQELERRLSTYRQNKLFNRALAEDRRRAGRTDRAA